MVGGACASAPGFIEIAGKAAEGAYMSTAAWLDDPRPEVQAYLKKIVAKNNGKKPPYGGPRAYDIIYSYKHCIEKSGVTNKPADLDCRPRQDPRLPCRPQELPRRRRRDHHGREPRRRGLERHPQGGQRQVRQRRQVRAAGDGLRSRPLQGDALPRGIVLTAIARGRRAGRRGGNEVQGLTMHATRSALAEPGAPSRRSCKDPEA